MKKKLRITVEGKSYEVEVEELEASGTPHVQKPKIKEEPAPSQTAPKEEPASQRPSEPTAEGEKITAPIPGKVLALKCKIGDKVKAGDLLMVLEAMKMENEITAPKDGEVKEILVQEGQSVQTGDPMIVIG